MFVLFFGGISIHLFAALFCHFFSIKLTWTATAKEVEKQGLRVGLDKIFKDFKYMYAFMVPVIGGKCLVRCITTFGICIDSNNSHGLFWPLCTSRLPDYGL